MQDGARLRLDEVEVVEQPLGRGRNGDAAMDVVSEAAVRRAEGAEVLVEAGQDVAAVQARRRGEREPGGERFRALFQTFEAQELAAEGRGRLGAATSKQGSPLRGTLFAAPVPLPPLERLRLLALPEEGAAQRGLARAQASALLFRGGDFGANATALEPGGEPARGDGRAGDGQGQDEAENDAPREREATDRAAARGLPLQLPAVAAGRGLRPGSCREPSEVRFGS